MERHKNSQYFMSDKKTEKMQNLQAEFNKIQEDNKDFNANTLIAKLDDLPDLGDIQIYDYEKDLDEVKDRASDVMESLVDLYLGDLPRVIEHPYIKNKVKEDASGYAESLFLTKMTRKTLISQLRSIDNGNNGARDYEVVNQTMQQMRENQKYADEKKTKLENFYKEFKKDLGLTKVADDVVEDKKEEAETKGASGVIMDSRTLNEMIAKATMQKK